jgi:hypothetical protein
MLTDRQTGFADGVDQFRMNRAFIDAQYHVRNVGSSITDSHSRIFSVPVLSMECHAVNITARKPHDGKACPL